jgi:putative hydrolase of the HAD superfamily
MIKAVTVDFWNTIVIDSSNGAARRAYRDAAVSEVFERIGVPYDGERIKEAHSRVWSHFEEVWLGTQRTMTTSECLHYFWKVLGVAVPLDMHNKVVKAFQDSILEGLPSMLDGAEKAIRELASRYRLALISDTAYSPGSSLREVLARHGLLELFSALVFSDEVGASKPHPSMFRRALDTLGVEPADSVHIGDLEATDIKGAKDIGMHAVLLRVIPGAPETGSTSADYTAETWADAVLAVKRLDSGRHD